VAGHTRLRMEGNFQKLEHKSRRVPGEIVWSLVRATVSETIRICAGLHRETRRQMDFQSAAIRKERCLSESCREHQESLGNRRQTMILKLTTIILRDKEGDNRFHLRGPQWVSTSD